MIIPISNVGMHSARQMLKDTKRTMTVQNYSAKRSKAVWVRNSKDFQHQRIWIHKFLCKQDLNKTICKLTLRLFNALNPPRLFENTVTLPRVNDSQGKLFSRCAKWKLYWMEPNDSQWDYAAYNAFPSLPFILISFNTGGFVDSKELKLACSFPHSKRLLLKGSCRRSRESNTVRKWWKQFGLLISF